MPRKHGTFDIRPTIFRPDMRKVVGGKIYFALKDNNMLEVKINNNERAHK